MDDPRISDRSAVGEQVSCRINIISHKCASRPPGGRACRGVYDHVAAFQFLDRPLFREIARNVVASIELAPTDANHIVPGPFQRIGDSPTDKPARPRDENAARSYPRDHPFQSTRRIKFEKIVLQVSLRNRCKGRGQSRGKCSCGSQPTVVVLMCSFRPGNSVLWFSEAPVMQSTR